MAATCLIKSISCLCRVCIQIHCLREIFRVPGGCVMEGLATSHKRSSILLFHLTLHTCTTKYVHRSRPPSWYVCLQHLLGFIQDEDAWVYVPPLEIWDAINFAVQFNSKGILPAVQHLISLSSTHWYISTFLRNLTTDWATPKRWSCKGCRYRGQ